MKCKRSQERLQDFLDETLEPAEQAELAEHLAACEACRGELEALRKVAALVGALDELPEPEGFLQGVRARLERVSVWERVRELLTRPLRPGYAVPVIIVAFFVVFLVMNLPQRVSEKARQPESDERNAPFSIAYRNEKSPAPPGETARSYASQRSPADKASETEETADHSLSKTGSGGATFDTTDIKAPGKPSLEEKDKADRESETLTYSKGGGERPEESGASGPGSAEETNGSRGSKKLEGEASAGPSDEEGKALDTDRSAALRRRNTTSLDDTSPKLTLKAGGGVRGDVTTQTEKQPTNDETVSSDLERETTALGGTEDAYRYQKQEGDQELDLVVRDLPTDRAHVERIVADAGGRITELRTKARLSGLLVEVPEKSFPDALRLLTTYNTENARALQEQEEAQRQKPTTERSSVSGPIGQQQSALRTLPLILRRLIEKQAVTQPAETQQQGEQRQTETPQ
jgi:hypothetical protein